MVGPGKPDNQELKERKMKTSGRWLGLAAVAAVAAGALLGFAPGAFAEDAPAAAAPKIDSGDTAWMLTSTALVLMMTIPGVALFYAGMVRKKNVLATMMQSFAITCLVTVLWMVIAYSLAFIGDGKYIGDLSQFMPKHMAIDSVNPLGKTIPEGVYMCFQLTFAIITCALIVGSLADRMKFSALLWFIGLWLILEYAPVAHWVWGGGFLGTAGVLDYAGGTVVHINAGIAGLVGALVMGNRKGCGHDNFAPYNLTLAVTGPPFRWFRWFCFTAPPPVPSH